VQVFQKFFIYATKSNFIQSLELLLGLIVFFYDIFRLVKGLVWGVVLGFFITSSNPHFQQYFKQGIFPKVYYGSLIGKLVREVLDAFSYQEQLL
jgi:hypothetical protein